MSAVSEVLRDVTAELDEIDKLRGVVAESLHRSGEATASSEALLARLEGTQKATA